MKTSFKFFLVMALWFPLSQARAGLLDFHLDGQVGYTSLSKIKVPQTDSTDTLAGGIVGVRAKLKILFLSGVIDYQHFFSKADSLHVGLGTDLSLPFPVVEPYVRGTVGLLMLDASAKAFDPDAPSALDNELGFQAKAGAGLQFPFLGDWFAFGVGGEIGYHYLTGHHGMDFSILGFVGLRV